MKKRRNIQLFTMGESEFCEINAELVNYTIREGCIELTTKEEGSTWFHIFPLHNVAMVRISNND